VNVYYSFKIDCPVKNELLEIAKRFNSEFPGIYIFLNRGDLEYSEIGRFHTLEELLEIEKEMWEFLIEHLGGQLVQFDTKNWDEIYGFVKQKLV